MFAMRIIIADVPIGTSAIWCFSWRYNPVQFNVPTTTEYQAAIDLTARGRVIREPLITHRFKIEDYGRAFDVVTHKGREEAVKVVFDHR